MEKNKISSKKTRKIIVLSFLAFTIIVGYVIFRGKYLEILETGEQYAGVFWKNLSWTITAFAINFATLFLIIFISNIKIKKGLKVFFDEDKKEMPKLPNKSIAFIFAIVISTFTTNILLRKFLLCFNSASFEILDPIFGYDISYFMFKKPFIEFMLFYLLAIVIGITIYTVIYYIISFNAFFNGIDREILKKSHFTKQIISHIIIIVILISGLTYLGTHNMITDRFIDLEGDTSYSLYGSGFTDVAIKVWGYRILSLVMVVSVILAIIAFKKNKAKNIIKSLLITPAYLVLLLIILLFTQIFMVNSNELDKEKYYISQNIEYTKKAYGIEIDEINIGDNITIDEKTINNNSTVIENIPVVNSDIVLKNLNDTQNAKGYYSYRNTQIAKIDIKGKTELIYISPRNISDNLNRYNRTYEYTHGYGFVAVSAGNTTEDGDIEILQKGFENNEIVNITEPRIYFGTNENSALIVDLSKEDEFDYPILDSSKAENKKNTYKGDAGLKLNIFDRFILGIKEGNLQLMFSSHKTKDSKVLINRNIIKRAELLMPYLIYDKDPYLVVDEDGKLFWILDAYTTSENYPYSQMTTMQIDWQNKINLNYIRNSIKVIVDAYNGDIKFYITDRNDPIAMSYRNIYPDLFMDKDENISDYIKNQFIYPEFLYKIQSEIICRYHNIQPDVLYRGDDVWDIATTSTSKVNSKKGINIEPYYSMLKTVDSSEPKLGIVLPYTQHQKQNIISYLIGEYENGNPVLSIYKFNADTNILGTMQFNALVEQDDYISKEIEKLNTTGTKITKDILVVPIDDSLLYVQPVYQQYTNESISLPLLKKVIVASGNKLAIGNNIEEALKNLLSQSAVDIEIEETDNIDDLIKAIIKANDNLEKSNSSNNWEMIGKDMQKLQELINKLKVLKEKEERSNLTIEKILSQNTLSE